MIEKPIAEKRMTEKYNKKLVIILRILLFIFGAIIGYLAMWQFLRYFNNLVSEKFNPIFQMSAAVFLGLVLCVSTKAILWLSITIGSFLKRIFTVVRPVKIAGVIIGVVIGAMAAYLIEALLGLVLHITALRIVIDVVAGVAVSFLASIACVRWLESSETEVPMYDGGYILTPQALEDDRIVSLCENWLIGDKVVLLTSINQLIKTMEEDDGKKSLVNYEKLISNKTIRVIDSDKSGLDAIAAYSISHRMKIIAKNREEFDLVSLPKYQELLVLEEL